MNKLRRFFRYITGQDLAANLDPENTRNGSDPQPAVQLVDHALFRRLYAESSSRPHVRRVKTDIREGTRLVDEIIMLMFNLQRPAGGYLQGSLVAALDQRRLITPWNVLYIYADQDINFSSAYELQDTFYDRIMELSTVSTRLKNFLNERYQLQQRLSRLQTLDSFDPDNPNHRGLLVNLFNCQFSICLKDFPEGSTEHIFLVARMAIYDAHEMDRYRLTQPQGSGGNNQGAQQVYLAATVKAAGRYEERPVKFNAHRFGRVSDNSPQREFSLYVGNWRTDWEFSIGSADHDEIQHPSMMDRTERFRINNLQISNNTHWEFLTLKPNLPSWMKFYELDATRTSRGEGIRLCCVKPPTLHHPLLNVISRQQFRQEISLIGRVLPNSGGQVQRFLNDVTDKGLRELVRDLEVVSAIEVRDSLWVILTDDQKVMRLFYTDQRGWDSAPLDHGSTFVIADTEYRWHPRRGDLYPDRFLGALSIYPAAGEIPNFKKQLNVDKDAEGFLVSFDGQFERKINPDELLGSNGIVSIKCVAVSDEGRGKYALLPVQDPVPLNSFFAFQPVYAREKGWPAGKSWLTYKDDPPSDLTIDEDTGEVLFEGDQIRAEDHTYHLICGTSLFQLKVSGTPYIGTATTTTAAPVSVPSVSAVPAPALAPSEFKPVDIQMQLLRTRWAGYAVQDADRSNFAAHFHLTHPKQTTPTYFIKAFFPQSVESSNRELNFYERYRSRADELFLRSPEILRKTNDPDEAPWALVFPLLHTYEKYLSSAGQTTLWLAAAVGVGMATLFQAMAEDDLINFDIDITQFCFDSDGRLVIVDFDNVFRILTDPEDEAQLVPLLGILKSGRLPAKNSVLPPEAHAFTDTNDFVLGPRKLAEIGVAFNTYMLAVVVLQLLRAEIPLKPETLVCRAASEKLNQQDVKQFEALLTEMLSPNPADRPRPSTVRARLEEIVSALCKQNDQARTDCKRLLGRELEVNRG